MVYCCVPGCVNYSAKSNGISYHKLPRDTQWRKAWLKRIRRNNMPPLENCYVCSEHFLAERFEVNLRAQITELSANEDWRRMLYHRSSAFVVWRRGQSCLAKIVFDVEATKKLVSLVYRSSSRIVISIILNKFKHSYASYRYQHTTILPYQAHS